MAKKGGRWKPAEPYVTCGNPSCRPWGPNGPLSWRTISRGPGVCKHCGDDFPIAIRAGQQGWTVQDAKGRSRPAAAYASATANAAAMETVVSDEVVRNFLLATWRGTDEELDAHIAMHFPKKPEPPPPPLEQYKDALAKLDKAQRNEKHMAGQVAQKEASFVRQCQALKDYAESVREAKSKLEEAKADVITAQHALQQLRQEAPQVAKDPKELLTTYDPTASIYQRLSSLQVLSGLQHEQANAIGNVLVQVVREHLGQAVQHMFPQIDAAIAASAPTASAAISASDGSTAAAFTDGIPGDAAMKSEFKRGISEVGRDTEVEIDDLGGLEFGIDPLTGVTQALCNDAMNLANSTLAMASTSLGAGPAGSAAGNGPPTVTPGAGGIGPPTVTPGSGGGGRCS